MWNDALPRQGITNWQTFYAAQSTTTTNSWQSWTKPAGCSWIYIFCQAAGGGGGRGTAADGPGSGGGGAGGTTRMLVPAFMVPDILYVRPGEGGLGSTTLNTAGDNGVSSFVSMAANVTTANLLLFQTGGNGGAANTTAGTAGAAGTTIQAMVGVSLFSTTSGLAGSNGGAAGSPGVDITQTTSSLTTGGTGGGGELSNVEGKGGNIINNVVFPTLAGGQTPSPNGRNGFQLGAIISPGLKSFPMIFSGGTGGEGGGGNGGNASYGGGGGGAGSGSTSANPGNGGNGGDGFIVIGAF